MAIDIGTGATVAFGTSTWTANITSIDITGPSRTAIETTHLGTTGARTFKPGDLYDGGEVTLEVLYDGNTPPPYAGAIETVTVTIPTAQTNGSTWAASMFVTAFNIGIPLEDNITATVTLKVADDITQSDGS